MPILQSSLIIAKTTWLIIIVLKDRAVSDLNAPGTD